MASEKNTSKFRDRWRRQKTIALLEQFAKKCFSLFRSETTTPEQIAKTIGHFAQKLEPFRDVELYSPYQRALYDYTTQLIDMVETAGRVKLDYQSHLRELNRLQKLKNQNKYKRE